MPMLDIFLQNGDDVVSKPYAAASKNVDKVSANLESLGTLLLYHKCNQEIHKWLYYSDSHYLFSESTPGYTFRSSDFRASSSSL